MVRVIEEAWEKHIKRCNHCGAKLEYTVDDVERSTYVRGLDLEYSEGEDPGWIDGDCLWHYISCPRCGKYVCVTGDLNAEECRFLEQKS
jgi:hypothetical protein